MFDSFVSKSFISKIYLFNITSTSKLLSSSSSTIFEISQEARVLSRLDNVSFSI